MSEMIVVECDYEDGNCIERFSGFSMTASESCRKKYLENEGWLVRDDKHYCPLHHSTIVEKKAESGE